MCCGGDAVATGATPAHCPAGPARPRGEQTAGVFEKQVSPASFALRAKV